MDAKTVLVVDDEEDSRDICRAILENHGYQVLQAIDGEYAVRLAREHHPDLILMDLMLPKLTGWSAGEWIKRDPETADIPVVALTVRAAEADRERARVSGFDSYLAKPCSPGRVLAEVKRLIGPATTANG